MKRLWHMIERYYPWLLLLLGVDCFCAIILWISDIQAFQTLIGLVVLTSLLLFSAILFVLNKRDENVKNSTVKPTERFREEGVGREPFSKGVPSDRLKCSSCRNGFGKILSALFHGRKSSVGRVDPSQVVVMDVSVNHALYLIRRHFCRIHLVQLLLVAKKLSILALS